MLLILRRGSRALEEVDPGPDWRLQEDVVWVDLVEPTREEELAVEACVRLDLPTREEMAEIEVSSRLYQKDGATFMVATLLRGSKDAAPTAGPVTFVLAGERLVTIRYLQPHAFKAFCAQAERQPELAANGRAVFLGLLETVIDRTADLLEQVAADVEGASQAIFVRGRGIRFRAVLNRLAACQSSNGKARESLVSLARLLSFAMLAGQFADDRDGREQLRSMQRDVQSLTEHSSYVSGNLSFLLDAALGLINIEQNEITKIFSIAAVVLLPPTLLATIWGMNFRHMPELALPWGYPLAIVLMIVSAVVPFWWFRRKGWL